MPVLLLLSLMPVITTAIADAGIASAIIDACLLLLLSLMPVLLLLSLMPVYCFFTVANSCLFLFCYDRFLFIASAAVCVLFITSSPDIHFFCFCNQFVAEIRMCNRYNCLCLFPGRKSFDIYNTKLRYQKIRIGTRIRNYRSRIQRRQDSGFYLSIPGLISRRTANKTLTAF